MFGISCVILSPIWAHYEEGDMTEQVVLAADIIRETRQLSTGLCWLREASVGERAWESISSQVDVSSMLCKFLANLHCGQRGTDKIPWRCKGWFAITANWAKICLCSHGMKLVSNVQVVKHTCLVQVLKCSARKPAGHIVDIFIKVALSTLSEGDVIAKLATLAPNIVPKIIDSRASDTCFIAEDAGSVYNQPFDLNALMETIAELHTRTASHVELFRQLGMPCRNASWLENNVDSVMENAVLDHCLEDTPIGFVRDQVQKIKQLCRELSAVGIPDTVVHGDLHTGNVGGLSEESEQRRYRLLDWGSSFIGHPFCDLVILCRESDEDFEISEGAACDLYFNVWKRHASWEELHRAADMAYVMYWALNLCSAVDVMNVVKQQVDRDYVMSALKTGIERLAQALSDVNLKG